MFFLGFFKFLIFYENNTNFEHIFYEQIRHKLSFIYKKISKVCTQLRIFPKEIKSTLNQELMHILGERGKLVRVIIT
jgi:hypothetical protein